MGLIEKMTFEQRLEGDEVLAKQVIFGKSISGRTTTGASIPGVCETPKLQQQSEQGTKW